MKTKTNMHEDASKENTDDKTLMYKCVICHRNFTGFGNNPQPVKEDGRACDNCNVHVVIPARIEQLNDKLNLGGND